MQPPRLFKQRQVEFAKGMHPSAAEIVEGDAGRAEEQGIDLVEVASNPFKEFSEGHPIVAGAIPGTLGPMVLSTSSSHCTHRVASPP